MNCTCILQNTLMGTKKIIVQTSKMAQMLNTWHAMVWPGPPFLKKKVTIKFFFCISYDPGHCGKTKTNMQEKLSPSHCGTIKGAACLV